MGGCLGLQSNDTKNGALVALGKCVKGSKTQEWIFSQPSGPPSLRIASALDPSKCIDAHDMKPGTHLTLEDCTGFPQQQFGFHQNYPSGAGWIYFNHTAWHWPLPDQFQCLALDTDAHTAVVAPCTTNGLEWNPREVTPAIMVV